MWGQNEIFEVLIQPLDSHSLISATKMTKKLFLNFIEMLRRNLSKAFKDDIFENQKVVATTLSNLNKNEEFRLIIKLKVKLKT